MLLGRAAPVGHRQSLVPASAASVGGGPAARLALPWLQKRKGLVVVASFFGGGGNNKEEAARKALQGLDKSKFGSGMTPKPVPGKESAKPPAPGAPGNVGGVGGTGGSPVDGLKNLFSSLTSSSGGGGFGSGAGNRSGGGGGGGFSGFGGSAPGDDETEKPILQDLKELFQGISTVVWNTALFLAVASWLHRTLSWCIEVELLFLVGAPQQALEKLAGLFYSYVEAFEKNVLGWKIPGEPETMKTYEEVGRMFPREHAYTFDGYRYPMTEPEKSKLIDAYALRHWERPGGFRGDVDKSEVQRIRDKYEPLEADRREWQRARAAGTLDQYWAAKAHVYEEMVGTPRAPVASAAVPGSAATPVVVAAAVAVPKAAA